MTMVDVKQFLANLQHLSFFLYADFYARDSGQHVCAYSRLVALHFGGKCFYADGISTHDTGHNHQHITDHDLHT